jgi:D-sedoheptulose 7-phosphate isomerase
MIEEFLSEVKTAIDKLNRDDIKQVVDLLKELKGRLFIIGSGGGAGHASHAVCDFRKLCEIESYAVYDNISELTARTNDEGYETSISQWLKVSNFNSEDCLFVFSVFH